MFPSLPLTCLFYAGGLLGTFYFHVSFQLSIAVFLYTGFIALFSAIENKKEIFRIAFFVFAFSAGLFIGKTPYLPSPQDHLEHYAEQRITFTARVLEPPAPRDYGMRMKAECLQVLSRHTKKSCTGTTLIYAKEAHQLQTGDIVKISGNVSTPPPSQNPGEFSFQTYMLAKGIHVVTYADFITKQKPGSPFSLKRLSFSLRDAFISVYEKTLPKPYDVMLTAFIFGSEAAEIPDDMERDFRIAGIIHLMVASGAQIALLLMTCLLLNKLPIKTLPVAKIATAFISFLFILSYTFMTQGGFSILRAFIMGCVLLLSVAAERDYDALNALFFSALLLLVLHPLALLDAGFQLSFAATFGIIYLSPKLYALFKSKIEKPSRTTVFFAYAACATLSAQLFVTPFILFYFNGISAFSLLTNLIALPFAGLLVPLGFVTGFLGLISIMLAKIAASLCGFFLLIILIAAQKTAQIPYGFIETARPSVFFFISYYFVIMYFTARVWFSKNFPSFSPSRIMFIVIALNAIPVLKENVLPRPLKVIFFDIGQGDSILIETPDKAHILIDGGGARFGQTSSPGERTLVPYMKREGIRRLDLVVLTHPHRDHLEGLLSVLKERKISQLLYSSLDCNEPFCDSLQTIVRNKKIKTIKAARGMKFSAGKDVTLTVLHPDIKFLTNTPSNIDNNSVALLMQYKNARFLFPGDVYIDGETSILKSGIFFRADVLKVPHHGSRHSSTLPFLRMVKPRVAVISCSLHNVFHHPSPQTLKNLQLQRARVFRTDSSGAVMVETDGYKIESRTMY